VSGLATFSQEESAMAMGLAEVVGVGDLASLSRAEALLAEAVDLVDIVQVVDLAAAAKELAARAKLGLAAQNHAAVIKLKAERKAGELLARLERRPGERTDRTSPNDGRGSEYAEALAGADVSTQNASRWQAIAAHYTDEDLEAAAADAIARAEELTQAQLLRATRGVHVGHNSGHVEWFTPARYADAAREVMGGIDLDPASCAEANKVIGAARYYTEDDDGLAQVWSGRVWMNPPYRSGLIERFTSKLADSYLDGGVTEAVVVVNNATETGWFQTLAAAASVLCFPRGRISFWRTDREAVTPLQGQALMYLGRHPARFRVVFDAYGTTVVVP
jgi:phage N-6-adenine-methyltransferase